MGTGLAPGQLFRVYLRRTVMADKKSAGSKKTVAMLLVGVVCAAAAVILIAARMPALEDVVETRAQSTVLSAPLAANSVTAKKAPAKAVSASKMAAPAAASVQRVSASSASPAIESAPMQVAETPAVKASLSPVTVTGCLERDGETFRLKDADGQSAPKARSWKSGFLKKGAPKVEVIDSANRLKLKDHVGQRVSVTGMLDEREMQARSLQRVSSACE
jgi:hypothetical protein